MRIKTNPINLDLAQQAALTWSSLDNNPSTGKNRNESDLNNSPNEKNHNKLDVNNPSSGQNHNESDQNDSTNEKNHNELDVNNPSNGENHNESDQNDSTNKKNRNELDVNNPSSGKNHNESDQNDSTNKKNHNELDVNNPSSGKNHNESTLNNSSNGNNDNESDLNSSSCRKDNESALKCNEIISDDRNKKDTNDCNAHSNNDVNQNKACSYEPPKITSYTAEKNHRFSSDYSRSIFYKSLANIDQCIYLHIEPSAAVVCKFVKIPLSLERDGDYHSLKHKIEIKNHPSISGFWLYTSSRNRCHMLYCQMKETNAQARAIFSHVRMNDGVEKIISSLKNKAFICVIDGIQKDIQHVTNVVISVFLMNDAFPNISYPSEPVGKSIQRTAIKTVTQHFHPEITPHDDTAECYTLKHDIDEFFRELKVYSGRYQLAENDCPRPIQHPSLIPTLRPYQREAVRWMLARELTTDVDNCLHPGYAELTMADGSLGYYNTYMGFFTKNRPNREPVLPGGILADEMGLGKTVEFLACMLSHPGPSLPDTPLQPTISQEEWELQKTLKPKSSKRVVDDDPSRNMTTDTTATNSVAKATLIDNSRKRSHTGELINTQPQKFVSCHCGFNTPNFFLGNRRKEKLTVECIKCGMLQHATCVYFDLTDRYRGDYVCPLCCIKGDPIPSAATLIISPAAISHQWCEEIKKHIRNNALRVLVYTGIKNKGFVHPHILKRYDVVVTTYDILRKDMDFVGIWQMSYWTLTRCRNYCVLPSPIVAINWWRVCFDEAQMVESAFSKTAEMAQHLHAVNMWCVTGTPIPKSVNDLYGLMVLLAIDPYIVQKWWKLLLYDPFCYGRKQPMYEVLAKLLWRTTKAEVVDQINIPRQEETTHWLTFSPVEEHFYRRTFQDCQNEATAALSKWTDASVKLNSLDKKTSAKLLQPLLRLRQACCHPQAVRGAFLPINKSTMTMGEVLQSLIKKVKTEGEEAHRQLVSANNGLAAIAIIRFDIAGAVELYREVLLSVDAHRAKFRTDELQQLHALHNLNEMLGRKPAGVARTLRDDDIPRMVAEIESKYAEHAEGRVAIARESLVKTRQELTDAQTQTVHNPPMYAKQFNENTTWWDSVLDYIGSLSQDLLTKLLEKIQDDLNERSYNKRKDQPYRFREAHGLKYILYQQLDLLASGHTKLVAAVRRLNHTPLRNMLNRTVDCCLRPTNSDASIDGLCEFCKADELFSEYEEQLFQITDSGACHVCHSECSLKCDVLIKDGYCPQTCHKKCPQKVQSSYKQRLQPKNKLQRTWADSDLEAALKVILSFSKSYTRTKEWCDTGANHLKMFEALKKEFKALRAVWTAIYEHVAAIDELSMATTRLRLRHPDEAVPDPPVPYIIEPFQLNEHREKLMSDKMLGQAELDKKLGQLSYLQNMERTENDNAASMNPEPCPICNKELGTEWAVLRCAHCFCHQCIQLIMDKYTTQRVMLRCAICRESTHASNVSYVSVRANQHGENGAGDDVSVKGSHSTKVDGIIRCLLRIRATEPDAKVLIFSTWVDILDVVGGALRQNDITYRTLDKLKDFQKNLACFKTECDVTALLLPVHSGANGLNLVEANHVLLVEPILHHAQQLQAVGRIHRIGQTKPTTIHHFIIRGTIEERMRSLTHSMPSSPDRDDGLTIGNLSSLMCDSMDEKTENPDIETH